MREARPVLSTLLLAIVIALPAGAVEVTTTADVIADDGECSLREAILLSNGTPANDDCQGTPAIQLVGGATYTLTIPGASEDAAATGDLDVLLSTVVYSDTAGVPATIDGGGIDRIFDVFGQLILLDVVVRNGAVAGPEPECVDGGGGVRIGIDAVAVLSRVSVVDSMAAICGGGILNLGVLFAVRDLFTPEDLSSELSTLAPGVGSRAGAAITKAEGLLSALAPRTRALAAATGTPRQATADSHLPTPAVLLLEDNVAIFGGGLWTADTTLLVGATIDGNEATRGGGIFSTDLVPEEGVVILDRSTVSNNRAVPGLVDLTPIPGEGGGMYQEGEVVLLINSTFSGNAALDAGGTGGAIHHTGALVILVHDTIFANSATTAGGIYVADGIEESLLLLLNSIVAENTGADCLSAAPGQIISGGDNIDSDDSCNLGGPPDQAGVDPLLGPLADNGGPTRTHLPLAGSPAIDAVTNEREDEDQRFFPRPVDGDGDGVVASDIGAVEVSAPPVTEIPTAGTLGFALLATLLAAAGLWTLRRPSWSRPSPGPIARPG